MVQQDTLATLPGVVGVGGYFATSDGFQHVIAATNDGNIHEIYFKGGGQPVGQDVLATLPGVVGVGVGGYFSASDGFQHVFVSTNDGNIHEIYFKGGGQPVGQDVLATLPGVVGVGGYFATSDGFQHVIAATNDGNIHEIYFMGAVAPVSGGILATGFVNPAVDSNTASAVCSNQRWLENDSPVWQWTPLLNSATELSSDIFGVSGVAVNPDISSEDVPFTHPFGKDFEFFIAPDPQYVNLLALNNLGESIHIDPEYHQAYVAAQAIDPAAAGVLGVEVDSGLVPPAYRTKGNGERVVVFGRLISDCGHTDFHSEIHPPLLMGRAEATSTDSTRATVIGCPFLVSQDFGDGALRKHLLTELGKCLGEPGLCHDPVLGLPLPPGIPCSTQIEAHPRILTTPFTGHLMLPFVVRPPSGRKSATDALVVSFHFTVRSGVTVLVAPYGAGGEEGVNITVSLDSSQYKSAALPPRHDVTIAYGDLGTELASWAGPLLTILRTLPNPVLDSGIKTDQYDNPNAASVHDNEVTTAPLAQLGPGPHFTRDDSQPFPVYGWLSLTWQRGGPTPIF